MDAVYVVALLAAFGLFVWAVRRQNEIFRVFVRNGRVTGTRGRVPPSFVSDLREIVRGVDVATIRAVKQDGAARLVVPPSVDEATGQRLRNAFALQKIAKRA